jgi:hypothetical protein
MAQHFPQATFRLRLEISVLTLHVMQGVLIDDWPTHRFEMTMDVLQNNSVILHH